MTAFRFQSILDQRLSMRDQAAMEIGKVNEAIAKIESDIAGVDDELSACNDTTDGRTGAVSVDRLLTRGRYALQLTADRRTLVETLGKLHVELEARRSRLAAAQTEVRKFELLRDRHAADRQATVVRRQQSVADEFAGRMHRR